MTSPMEQELAQCERGDTWMSAFKELLSESGQEARRLGEQFHGKGLHLDWHWRQEAEKKENRPLNRSRSSLPYDANRVRLQLTPSDYINASHVTVPEAGRAYIVAQAPLANTSGDLWLMAWQQGSMGVLMLTALSEEDREVCHKYYPDEVERRVEFPDAELSVELVESTLDACGDTCVRLCRLTFRDDSRLLWHLQLFRWPPSHRRRLRPLALLQFLLLARSLGLLSDAGRPAIVHCAPGAGRSAALLLSDVCMTLIGQRGGADGVSVRRQLRRLMAQRMGLVLSWKQLRLCYLTAVLGGRAMADADCDESQLQFRQCAPDSE